MDKGVGMMMRNKAKELAPLDLFMTLQMKRPPLVNLGIHKVNKEALATKLQRRRSIQTKGRYP